ncbi:MAG: cytochrome c biogenesis protein CcdA [Syntrophomonas sp.]
MLEWLTNTLPGVLSNLPVFALILVFLGGVITSIGPCNLAMVPAIMAYVGGQIEINQTRSFWLSVFFTLGSATTFMILGVVIALVGGIFGSTQSILYYLVGAVCIMVGLSLLHLFQINLPWFSALQQYTPRRGIFGAYALGMVMGLAGSQCGTPILFAILSIVMLKGSIVYGAILLFFYALGRGLPVILAGTFTGILKSMPLIARWANIMEQCAGIVLLLLGAYFLWNA